MDYDGQSECVLNMKQFLFSYEVLRQHMFHFLLGRYTKIIVPGFQCSACGPNPSLVIMDATALSFRRQLDFWGNITIREGTAKERTVVSRKSR